MEDLTRSGWVKRLLLIVNGLEMLASEPWSQVCSLLLSSSLISNLWNWMKTAELWTWRLLGLFHSLRLTKHAKVVILQSTTATNMIDLASFDSNALWWTHRMVVINPTTHTIAYFAKSVAISIHIHIALFLPLFFSCILHNRWLSLKHCVFFTTRLLSD